MKAFTISTFLFLLASQLHAAPSSSARQFQAQLTFQGAPPAAAFFTLSVPTDGSVFEISNVLSVSHISSAGGASCTLFGIDGSTTTVVGADTVDVGPPQTQVSGSCLAL
ncbi:hypothetical protein HO173_011122 [Letharia columbiana]|uniref:Uncharacterized protein n=1 Tax=Letharia columbiana TaxID=112416 RepID=A0A8H6FLA4_9LECA|nr:uncharacterized protein HO173_011122 [Letharia columbiana]KAF6230585.1 hypothetical protein HO173_011122 [Letharia columbiana]